MRKLVGETRCRATASQGRRTIRNTVGIFGRLCTACSLALLTAGCGSPDATTEVNGDESKTPRPQVPPAAESAAAQVAAVDIPTPNRDGEDWPLFSGPAETGVSNETGLLESWPTDGPPVVWQRAVGTGYSAPSIRGRRLVIHHRRRNDEVIECLRADTGDAVWKHSYESQFRDPYGYNNGPRASPLLTDDRCYTLGAEGALYCVDLRTGEPVWQHDLQSEYDLPPWFFGMGCSPILEDNLLIVLVGGQPDAGVVAFDAETGKPVWKAVGRATWDGAATGWPNLPNYEWTGSEKVVSYSSPIVATIHGHRHLLCLMRQGLVSLDPATGKERFTYWFRSEINDSVNAARPVVSGNRILLSAAYETGAVLLEVNSEGNGISEIWRDRDNLRTHWSTPIHVDGFVYGFSGRHEQGSELRCLELETGKVRWSSTGFDGDITALKMDQISGDFLDPETGGKLAYPFLGRGSKTRVGDRFIVLGERGTLALVRIDPTKYDEICRTSFPDIDYPAWTAPVLSRKRLYLRSEKALLCLDLAKQQ